MRNRLFFLLLLVLSFLSITNLFSYENDDPNIDSNFLIPTAETNKEESFYVSLYELVYLNVGYTPIEHLNITAGFIAPITSEIIEDSPYSIGLKYQYIDEIDYNFAFMGSFTNIDIFYSSASFYTLGIAGNIYSDNKTLKFDYNLNSIIIPSTDYDDGHYKTSEFNPFEFYNIGFTISGRVSENAKIISEINLIKIEMDRIRSTLLLGLRFFGENLSFDIAAFTLLESVFDEELPLIPYLTISYHF